MEVAFPSPKMRPEPPPKDTADMFAANGAQKYRPFVASPATVTQTSANRGQGDSPRLFLFPKMVFEYNLLVLSSESGNDPYKPSLKASIINSGIPRLIPIQKHDI